jgi:hypothetical protein
VDARTPAIPNQDGRIKIDKKYLFDFKIFGGSYGSAI